MNAGVQNFLNLSERRREEEKQNAQQYKALASFAESAGWLTKDQAAVMDKDRLHGLVQYKMWDEQNKEHQQRAALEQLQLARKLQEDQDYSGFVTRFNNNMAEPPGIGNFYENPEQTNYERPKSDPMQSFMDASQAYPGAMSHPQFASFGTTFDRLNGKEYAPSNYSKLLDEMSAATKAGDKEKAAQLKLAYDKLITPSGMQLEVGPDGKITFSQGAGATTGFKTEAQKAQVNAAATFATIDHIMQNQKASDWGIRGLIGKVQDEWLAQALPAAADPRRIDVQAATSQLRQQMMAVLKAESQISQKDKEEIMQSLPKTTAGESPISAMQKIARAKEMMTDKIRAYSKKLGELPPVYAMSLEQIAEAVEKGKITEVEGADAILKYHRDKLR